MAKRTASAKKQARTGARRAARNRATRSAVKTLVVKARRALGDGSAALTERSAVALEAVSALDRAAAKKVLHPNNAARRKGRLARALAKVAAARAAPAGAARAGGAPTAPTVRGRAKPGSSAAAPKKR